MPKTFSQFAFTELSADALLTGRAFDGMAAGKFTDMHGQKVELSAADFSTFVSNTIAAINATKTASGDIVGLPIDARDHDKGDGAGWIVGIELAANGLIRLIPKWTELGRELIGKSIRRFFSPTVDLANKVILGGTLTNWPATRNAQGHILLRPIELAQGMYAPDGESSPMIDAYQCISACRECIRVCVECIRQCENCPNMDASHAACIAACQACVLECEKCCLACEQYGMSDPRCMEACRACVEKCNVCATACLAMTCELCKTTCSACADKCTNCANVCTMATMDMSANKESYIEAALNFMRGLFKKQSTAQAPQKEEIIMPVQLSQLSEADRAELIKQAAAQVDTGKMIADLSAQIGAELETKYNAKLVQMQAESQVANLALQLTNGTPDVPRGLRCKTDELKAHLLALPVDERAWFAALLQSTVKDGPVDYKELGHGKVLNGLLELPKEYAEGLDKGELKLANLSDPMMVAELGDLSKYDLSRWQKAEAK